MITTPSIDQILEGVLISMDEDIVPALGASPKAHATAQMIQSLLQGVRQMLPVMDEQLIEEHNGMIRTLREAGAALGDAPGDAADRIRSRADTLGAREELPELIDRAAITASHVELGRAIEASFFDLDELQTAGVAAADDALQVIRAHLGPRYLRDVETVVAGAGFVGRS